MYKSLAEVVDQLAVSLSSSLKQVQAWIDEQMAFSELVQESQRQASREIQTNRESTLNAFSTFMNAMKSWSGEMSRQTHEVSVEIDQVCRIRNCSSDYFTYKPSHFKGRKRQSKRTV